MEQRRRKLTDADIKAIEEQKINEIKEITNEYEKPFESIGHYLVTKFIVSTSDNPKYEDYDLEKDYNYSSEYVCQARITVERDKTQKDLLEEEEIEEEDKALLYSDEKDNEEEVEEETAVVEETEAVEEVNDEEEVRVDDEETNEKDDSLITASNSNRKVEAFSEVLILKIYKSFFMETVVTLDDYNQLKSDLEEFYNHFSVDGETNND